MERGPANKNDPLALCMLALESKGHSQQNTSGLPSRWSTVELLSLSVTFSGIVYDVEHGFVK